MVEFTRCRRACAAGERRFTVMAGEPYRADIVRRHDGNISQESAGTPPRVAYDAAAPDAHATRHRLATPACVYEMLRQRMQVQAVRPRGRQR